MTGFQPTFPFHVGVELVSHHRVPEVYTYIYTKPDYYVKNVVTCIKKNSIIVTGHTKNQMDM